MHILSWMNNISEPPPPWVKQYIADDINRMIFTGEIRALSQQYAENPENFILSFRQNSEQYQRRCIEFLTIINYDTDNPVSFQDMLSTSPTLPTTAPDIKNKLAASQKSDQANLTPKMPATDPNHSKVYGNQEIFENGSNQAINLATQAISKEPPATYNEVMNVLSQERRKLASTMGSNNADQFGSFRRDTEKGGLYDTFCG